MNYIKPLESFFLFTRSNDGEIDEFFGPLLEEDLETVKTECFVDIYDVECLNESAFKLIYSRKYCIDFNNNWSDYLECFLEANYYDFDLCNEDLTDLKDEGIENVSDEIIDNLDNELDIIIIYDLCVIKKDEDMLNIFFDIDADPIHAAQFVLMLNKYCDEMFEIVVSTHTYHNGKELLKGEAAIEQFYNEKLFNMCLN